MQNVTIETRAVREQLECLKSGVAAVAAAEQVLLKGKAERLAALRREAQRRAEADAARLSAKVQELNAEHEQQVAVLRQAREVRARWIQHAAQRSREALARRMQELKDQRIGQAQGTMMRQRQLRHAQLEQAHERHEQFCELLGQARLRRGELRRSLLKSLRTFRPWITPWLEGRRNHFTPPEIAGTPELIHAALQEKLEECRLLAETARRLTAARCFRWLPLSLLTAVLVAAVVWLGMSGTAGSWPVLLMGFGVGQGLLLLGWLGALGGSLHTIRQAAQALAAAAALEVAAERESAAQLAAVAAQMHGAKADEGRDFSDTFREADAERQERLAAGHRKLDAQIARLPGKLDRQYARKLAQWMGVHERLLAEARAEADERTGAFAAGQQIVKAAITADTDQALEACATKWQQEVVPWFDRLDQLEQMARQQFPAWSAELCANWQAPVAAPTGVRIGQLAVDVAALAGGLPADERFVVPNNGRVTAPFGLGFTAESSVLIETDGSDAGGAARALHGIALRLLASHPPGRATFVFIDPVGLGKEFAGLMHLADYAEHLIHHRIWTQSTQIEERLAELNEHIEKVIQMYLRDEFATIHDYNTEAGTIAEALRFVVIAGFPAAFSDTAMQRLRAIASSGARCGVHLLIQRDLRLPLTDQALGDELRRTCLGLAWRGGAFHWLGGPQGADMVVLDPPPAHGDSIALVHRIGVASVDSNRVEVPFARIAPQADEMWTGQTSQELRVAIGRSGANKLQYLALGKGTRQHVLVAGKTGSGKSTLFHVMITNLALWCSPQQVEFYLVDFKKGVEFKCYASNSLPHARVVAIESDREFALSVLQRVDGELKRRGELFRQAGAQDLAGYARTAGALALPRSLLLIDEFQEFFTEDDGVAQEASLLLDRIVRQGRAFGIHVILGSQTLGGAYTLARATLGQMVVRIALQCNEADAHLIMDDDNPAPRLLNRPGEGIYNDQAGTLAANSPFQIVWLPEEEREVLLGRIRERAARDAAEYPPPVVFEGNVPADIRDNNELAACLQSLPVSRPAGARAWFGAPNSIKGPTEAVFQRLSGSHLLVVGQSAERSLSLLALSMLALAAQYPAGEVEFVVLDPQPYDGTSATLLRQLAGWLPHRVRLGGPAEVTELMSGLAAELAARTATAGRGAPEVFVLVHDLQRFKALKAEDDFRFSLDDDGAGPARPAQVLADLLGEGGPSGMHVLATTDTWNNVSRWIPRKLMAEFEMRVLFQMSANDSASLIDSPAAARLGLHRALFCNDHLGTLETFRPYAMPDATWWQETAGCRWANDAKTV